jgi:uncharacterized repeat protein (TIGR01451 family)
MVRRWCLKLLLAAGLALTAGCFGVSQNPSYFPHLVPFGDIIRTHAKPPGCSYYSNFDPHACRLEVRPLESTSPVQTQHVVIATVYDEKGVPRRNRRVEWMLEGAGNIIEVDESGIFPGRGYKVDNKYAVSYTNYGEHHMARGNVDPTDDFIVRPGQSWCVVSAAVEGDTHLTVYAPEVADWGKHKVFVTHHWVDAGWTLPPPSSNRSGTEHVLTTHVYRHTDRQPLAGYRVRYRILDGPPAVFLPARTQEVEATSDLAGNANAALAQVAPAQGVNRIGIEIIRPPDPRAASGVGITVGTGETTKEWLAPAIALAVTAPPSAAVGQEVPFTITVNNPGRIEVRSMTVQNPVPAGLQYVRSQPPAIADGGTLTWTLGVLAPGQAQTLEAVFQSSKVGSVTDCASVVTEEGLRDEKCATVDITAPQLAVTMVGPANGVVGVPINYQITVSNPGSGPATKVVLSDQFDAGLEHEARANPVILDVGTLGPRESRTVPLSLTPRQVGTLVNRVTATADGNLSARAEHPVIVQQAKLTVAKTGPQRSVVGRNAEWEIRVTNPGDVPLTGVVVRDQLPAEMSFQSAGQNGQLVNSEVVWNLGTLAPREQRTVQLVTRSERIAPAAVNVAVATADPGLKEEARAPLEIIGIPAFRLEVIKLGDPVEIGKRLTYEIAVTNTGSLPANQVKVDAFVPAELKPVRATGPRLTPTGNPVAATVTGQDVSFAAVDGVQPNQTLTYTIEAEGLKAGDVRFRTTLQAPTLQSPVVKEESTTIFDPKTAPPAAGAAPLPPGR